MCAHMCIEMSTCMCGVGKNQLRVRQGDVNQRKEKKKCCVGYLPIAISMEVWKKLL